MALDTPDVSAGVREYLNVSRDTSATAEWRNPGSLFENPWFKPLRFGLYGEDGKAISGPVERKDKVWVEIEGIVEVPDPALCVGYELHDNSTSMVLYQTFQVDQMSTELELPLLTDRLCLRSGVPLNLLNMGSYTLEINLSLWRRQWLTQPGPGSPSISFILSGVSHPSPYCVEKRRGFFALDISWCCEHVNID